MKEKAIKKATTFTILRDIVETSGRRITLPLAKGALIIARVRGEVKYYIFNAQTQRGTELCERLARKIYKDHVLDSDIRVIVKRLTEDGHIDVIPEYPATPGKKSLQAAWEILDEALTQKPAPVMYDRIDYTATII